MSLQPSDRVIALDFTKGLFVPERESVSESAGQTAWSGAKPQRQKRTCPSVVIPDLIGNRHSCHSQPDWESRGKGERLASGFPFSRE